MKNNLLYVQMSLLIFRCGCSWNQPIIYFNLFFKLIKGREKNLTICKTAASAALWIAPWGPVLMNSCPEEIAASSVLGKSNFLSTTEVQCTYRKAEHRHQIDPVLTSLKKLVCFYKRSAHVEEMQTEAMVAWWQLHNVLKCKEKKNVQARDKRTQKHMAVLMLEIHFLSQEVFGNRRKVRGLMKGN